MRPIDFVRQHPPFASLNSDDRELVEQTLVQFDVLPGTYILREDGAPSSYLYLIRRGIVRFLHKGEEVTTMTEGDTFGYPSMLLQEPPLLDALSGGSVVLYAIPENTFRQLVNHQPFAEYFLKDLSLRLQETWALDLSTPGSGMARPISVVATSALTWLAPESTVQEAAQLMRDQGVSSVLIDGDPPGIVTIKALCNEGLATGFGPTTPVAQLVNRSVKSIPADTPIYNVLLLMIEERVEHLPLTQDDQITGIVTSNDLLRYQTKSPYYLLHQLDNLRDPKAVVAYSDHVIQLVEALFDDGLQIDQIGRIVASLNDTLIRRLLKLAEADLGPPPTPYAWLVFGSEGRREQTLLTDQDNALVFEADSLEARTYFAALAQQVIDNLIRLGFPPCPGGYMASHWCYPLNKWTQLFSDWIHRPEPQALLEAATFFDFRAVHGELELPGLEALIARARNQPIFLARLARAALDFRPPLGFFRGIRDEDGRVDLKKGGIAPIVSLTRVYALEAGITLRPTLERLSAATQAGILSRERTTALSEVFRYLLHLRQREQLRQIQANQRPDNHLLLDRLLAHEKRNLRDALIYIRDMQEATAVRFRTSTLG